MTYRRVLLVLVLATAFALVAGAVAGVLLAHNGAFGGPAHTGSAADDFNANVPAESILTVSGDVDVLDGSLPLSPAQQGIIKAIVVHEGERVGANAPLIELDPTHADAAVEKAQAAVRAARTKVEIADQVARNYQEDIKQAKFAVAASEARLSAARNEVELLKKQVQAGTKDQLELNRAQDLITASENELNKAKSQVKQLEATDPALAVQAAKEEKATAEAALTDAKKARADCTVTAPVPGVVLQIQAAQGQVWNGMQQVPAIWFRPDKPWIVRCEVEQRYVYRVKEGMACDVFDDRVDKPTWKGKVQSCGRWIRAPRQKPEPMAFRDVRVMECIVVLDKPEPEPMNGQRVRVVFHGQPAP
jgi:multidrug resistance efflux pump